MNLPIHEDEDSQQAGSSSSVAHTNTYPLTIWDLEESPVPDVGPGKFFEWRLGQAGRRAELYHSRDKRRLRFLSRTEITYIRNMLLQLVRKLYLKTDEEVSVSELIDLAESITFDQLNDYPVPSRYWQSIRGIRDYYCYDGETLPESYDTAYHFAWHMAREENFALRRRWADAYELAYGLTIDEVASEGNSPWGELPDASGPFN
ncbi:hypothetical protein GTR04_0902 [Trichophyton interdigitale]|uniref:Uncharacterized protein n=1 Tax=Trichophyton interdigitale TaxID=101480 RepID=A0A9P5D1N6_9EURO|nr:hypothetical protein GY631_0675 [Trichophyton interdigitale]KAF3900793.1 hypothetical protein GY632_0527 [Trichophyton interdigitale]KAG8211695.1 hypothetical protein GTR04_0902 [Trichophyton interdigitale]